MILKKLHSFVEKENENFDENELLLKLYSKSFSKKDGQSLQT